MEREKTSPAPSQSDEVMMGGCVWVKPSAAKNWVRRAIASDRKRSRAALAGILGRRCGMVRRYSGVWNLFWMGYVLREQGLVSESEFALVVFLGY